MQETTILNPLEEQLFLRWIKQNNISDLDHPDSLYDYRGYWKEHGDTPIKFGVDHFPDTWKQHGHPTFSRESQYSTGAYDGGRWGPNDTYLPQLATSKSTPDSDQLSKSLLHLMMNR